MKSLVKKICVVLLVLAPIIGAVAQTETVSAISQSLKSGNTTQIAPFCAETITISIVDGDEEQMDKTAAMDLLDSFFTKYPPKSFSAKHDGKSKDGDTFTIGNTLARMALLGGPMWSFAPMLYKKFA